MSREETRPNRELLVEAIRWLLQLDMNDPKNWRHDVQKMHYLGEECGQVQKKR